MIPSKHKFIQSNSFEAFPLSDNSVDLIVTSPPYPMIEMWDTIWSQYNGDIGDSIDSGHGYEAYQSMHALLDTTWKECYRVLKDGGFACINIGDATRTLEGRFQLYSNHSRVLHACAELGFDILPSILWRKPTNSPTKFMGSGMLPGGAYVTLEHEWILIMRKGTKREYNPSEKTLRRHSAMFWEERNKWFSDQWLDILGTSQKLKKGSVRSRSGAFPIEVPFRLIAMYSKMGDVILDPFSGTGTTSLAAMMTARSSINIDADATMIRESIQVPTKRVTKGKLNDLLQHRLLSHLLYVASKDMLFFKYKNDWLRTPVKTMQEKDMRLHLIKSISRSEDLVEVKYRKWKSEELWALINR